MDKFTYMGNCDEIVLIERFLIIRLREWCLLSGV